MTGGADGVVKVFNYETGKMLAHLRTHADSVEGVQFAEKSVPAPNSDALVAAQGWGEACDVAIRLPLRPGAQRLRMFSLSGRCRFVFFLSQTQARCQLLC